MSISEAVLDNPIKELNLSSYPSNIQPIKAINWNEALDKIETALIEDGKHSAVYFLGDQVPHEDIEAVRRNFFKTVFNDAPFNNNYRAKQEDLTPTHSSPLLDSLSREARNCFNAIANKTGEVTVIQRYQLKTPKETSEPHFDFPNFHDQTLGHLPQRSELFLKGRNIRFIFSEAGEGPILFGPPKDKLRVDKFDTGAIANKADLGEAWQAKGRTLTAITGQQDWGPQAIAHASPFLEINPGSFRALTVFDIRR